MLAPTRATIAHVFVGAVREPPPSPIPRVSARALREAPLPGTLGWLDHPLNPS